MEITKWQTVILEWVNCLNLTQTVRNICDLKNDEFFCKLMAVINMDTSECVSLTEFLKKYYPAYNLEREPVLVQDDVEICNIYSLLLHYCCIMDARPELTAPLCTNLQQNTQILIKTFLEEIHEAKEITRDLLSDAIFNTNFLSTSFRSPMREPPQSPLLEFLKTPLKKQIFDSHKQEIKQLRAQLDLERFEKCDLQEELSLQYEKNKELAKHLQEKQAEIIQLRSERLNLDTCTNSTDASPEKRLETRRLKHEIQSLEKYIELMSKEQIEMQQERDMAREKLRRVEENYNLVQTQALNLERNLLSLSEENELHKSEIQNWKEKCDELSSLLNEFKMKKLEESYEMDGSDFNRSGFIDHDNLARTVVDLQLSDVQEENKSLRQQIQDLEANTNQLQTQFSELQLHCEQLTHDKERLIDKNSTLLTDNQEILAKLHWKNMDIENLRDEICSSKEKFHDLTKKYDSLFENAFNNFNIQIPDGSDMFKVEALLIEIENKFNLDSAKIEKFRETCSNLSQKIEELQEQILDLYNKNQEGLKEKSDLNKSLEDAKSNIANLEAEVDKSNKLILISKSNLDTKSLEISNLKETLKQKQAKIDFYSKQLKDAKQMYDEKDKSKSETVESQMKQFEKINAELKEIISEKEKFIEKANSCKILLQNELEESRVSLFVAETKIKELETFIRDKTVEIEHLHTNNENIISGLQKENQQLQKKLASKEENHSKEVTALKHSLELSKSDILELQKKVESKIVEVAKVTELITSLEQEKSKLSSDLHSVGSLHEQQIQEKNSICEELEKVKADLEEKIKVMQHLELKKHELEQCVEILSEELAQEKDTKKCLLTKCTNLEEIIKSVEQQMKILDTDRVKLNRQLESIRDPDAKVSPKQKENINYKIERLVTELDIADKANLALHAKLDKMNQEVKETETEMNRIQRQQNDFEQEIISLNQQLMETRQEKIDLQNEHKQLEEVLRDKDRKIDELRVEKLDIEKQVEITNQELMQQQQETSNKIKEIADLTEKLNLINVEISTIVYMFKNEEKKFEMSAIFSEKNLIPTVNDLKRNVCNLLMEKRHWNEESTTVQEYQKKLSDAQQKLEQTYSNTEELLKIHNHEIHVYQNEIQKLTENVHQLKEQIVRHKIQENDISEQLASLKSDLQSTVLDYQEAVDNQERTRTEHKRLQSEHFALQNVVKDLQEKITSLEAQKLEATQNLEKVKQKLKAEIKNVDAKEKIVQELNAKVRNESLEKNKLIIEILELNTSLSKEIEQKESLTQRISEFEIKFETINKELKLELTKNLELNEKVSQLSTNNHKLKQFCIESRNKLNSLYFLVFPQSKADNSDVDIENVSEMIERLSNELSNWCEICQENNDLKLKISNYEQEENTFHKELEVLKKILMENENKHKALQTEYEKLQDNYCSEVKKIEQELINNKVQIKEHEVKYEKLVKEHENIKKKSVHLEPELLNLQDKITNYQNMIQQLEQENYDLKAQLLKLSELQDKNAEMSLKMEQYAQQHELLEKTIGELKEKRLKDKKEFKIVLQKCSENYDKVLEKVRCEYEEQLVKMKEKVIRLYKEEMEKQKQKQIDDNEIRYEALKSEYDKLLAEYIKLTSKSERAKPQVIIEEVVTVQRKRRSITTVPPDCFPAGPEDEEGDMWSSAHLADLKMGRCNSHISDNRLSELQQRNSLYPPHLRSSYHPELQFATPQRVREEEIKNLNAGDSKKTISAKFSHSTQEQSDRRRPRHKDETSSIELETNRRRNAIRN